MLCERIQAILLQTDPTQDFDKVLRFIVIAEAAAVAAAADTVLSLQLNGRMIRELNFDPKF